MYSHELDPGSIDELQDATVHYLVWHCEKSLEDFIQLIERALQQAHQYPDYLPIVKSRFDGSVLYHRVVVWHFHFLYRVDDENQLLIVDRIYHERSEQ